MENERIIVLSQVKCARLNQSTLSQVIASTQRVPKTASLLPAARITCPILLSCGKRGPSPWQPHTDALFRPRRGGEATVLTACTLFSSVPELGEEGASGVRGPVLFHPPPNCRIREVHCGTQVRLVVIAIRDIAKGEEITVDYSLTDWGENAMVSRQRNNSPPCHQIPY